MKYTLDPWVVRWEQTMNQSLLLPSEKASVFIKFNLDGLLRGDYATRMNGYAIGRQNGWLSANDIRRLENMNEITPEEGGNLYLVNGNMVKLADAGAAYMKQSSENKGVPAHECTVAGERLAERTDSKARIASGVSPQILELRSKRR